MQKSLHSQLSVSILLIVLVTVGLISVLSNWFINREFENYIASQERERSESIVSDLGYRYNNLGGWSQDLIHTIGMYSLYDGYILKIYGADGNMLWDAENHETTLCGQIMGEISQRMESAKKAGEFESHSYDIVHEGNKVGTVQITYYGPFFFTESDYLFIRTLNTVLLVVGLLSAAFAFLAGGLLARRLARPITKTAYIASQIAKGNYGIRFEGTPDTRELGVMASAINHLADSLSEQENLRKRLTSDVAHELRTPLASIGTHLEAMIDGIWETSTEKLQGCLDEVKRLGTLVADLQQLANTESQNLRLQKTEVDLLDLVERMTVNFSGEIAKKHIKITAGGQKVIAWIDKDRMSQVLTNLISNAVKYTLEGGLVHTEVFTTDEHCAVSIKDSGVGISQEELPYIFERFYRTDKSRNRKTGGTGIGLTIAKSIVEAHGGRIEVESKVGEGSCFTVLIPK